MISRTRLKIDSWVQLLLAIGSLAAWATSSVVLALCLLWLLWLWQTGSALELWLDYKHHSRKPYLLLAPVLLVLALFFTFGKLLLAICAVVYIWHTVRDYQVVLRRPRSFWEL